MADDFLQTLTRFYREFIRPDTERVLGGLATLIRRMEKFQMNLERRIADLEAEL